MKRLEFTFLLNASANGSVQTIQTKQLTEARSGTTSFCELGKREKQALGLAQPALVTYMYVGKRSLDKEQSRSYPSANTRLLRLPRYNSSFSCPSPSTGLPNMQELGCASSSTHT